MKSLEFWNRYGFELTNTGGGCTALQKVYEPTGHTYLITDGEAEVPETINEPHTVTAYDEHGNETDRQIFKNAEEASENLYWLC